MSACCVNVGNVHRGLLVLLMWVVFSVRYICVDVCLLLC